MENLYYRTARNYKPGQGREKISSPSMTVPGETMTIQEILKRYRAGQPMEGKKVEYFDQEDLRKINRYFNPGALDITDIEELNKRTDELEKIVKSALQKKEEEAKRKNKPYDPEKPVTPDNNPNRDPDTLDMFPEEKQPPQTNPE